MGHPEIEMVQGGGADADPDLGGFPKHWWRHIHHGQMWGSTGGGQAERAHSCERTPCRSERVTRHIIAIRIARHRAVRRRSLNNPIYAPDQESTDGDERRIVRLPVWVARSGSRRPDPRAALRSSRARPGRGIVEAAQKGRQAGGCSEAGCEGRPRQEGRGKASGRQEVGTEEGKAGKEGEEGEEGKEGREEDRP